MSKPKAASKPKPVPIFSGTYSEPMWNAINGARTKGQLRRALYLVCCRVQELETRIEQIEERE